jgi:hypothetical protein
MKQALAVAFQCLAFAAPAAASPVVFAFDEYPDSSGCNAPVDAVVCSQYVDLIQTGDLNFASHTVDGLRLELSVESGAFFWCPGVDCGEHLGGPGNYPFSDPLVGRFSRGLRTVQIDIAPVRGSESGANWIDPYVYLEGYDASGALVGRVEAPAVPELFTTLVLSIPSGKPIREIRWAATGLGQIDTEGPDPFIIPNVSSSDNLIVSPVPEPTSAWLFLAGFLAMRGAMRRSRQLGVVVMAAVAMIVATSAGAQTHVTGRDASREHRCRCRLVPSVPPVTMPSEPWRAPASAPRAIPAVPRRPLPSF